MLDSSRSPLCPSPSMNACACAIHAAHRTSSLRRQQDLPLFLCASVVRMEARFSAVARFRG